MIMCPINNEQTECTNEGEEKRNMQEEEGHELMCMMVVGCKVLCVLQKKNKNARMPTKERQYRCSCVDASFDVNDLHDKTNIIGVGYNNMINFTIDDYGLPETNDE